MRKILEERNTRAEKEKQNNRGREKNKRDRTDEEKCKKTERRKPRKQGE